MVSGASIRSRSGDIIGHCPGGAQAIHRKWQGLLGQRPGKARDRAPGIRDGAKEGDSAKVAGEAGQSGASMEPLQATVPPTWRPGTSNPDSQVPVSLWPPRAEGKALGAFLGVGDRWGAGFLFSPPKRSKG